MPKIAPFNGIRYNTRRVGALSRVLTPPYDVISREAQDEFYKRHPRNFIRIDYGKTYSTDNQKRNRYVRAKQTFEQWIRSGDLKLDDELSVYPYQQEYQLNGKKYARWGVITLVHLGSKKIYPHEETKARPRKDRTKILEIVQATLSPIFGLIPDPRGQYDRWIQSACREKRPIASVQWDGIRHRLWRVSDQNQIQKLQQLLSSKEMIIADGHHRFEAAKAYWKKSRSRKKGSRQPNKSAYTMCYLASVRGEDPGLLPTHRVVSGLSKTQKRRLVEGVEACNGSVRKISSDKVMQAKLKQLRLAGQVALGVYPGSGSGWLLRAKAQGKHHMDVEWLHQKLLPSWVGKAHEVGYTQDMQQALRWLRLGKAQVIFRMQPPLFSQVLSRARAHRRMAAKTTYFYPKLLAGLVEYKF